MVAMKTVVNFYDGEELKENFLGALRAEVGVCVCVCDIGLQVLFGRGPTADAGMPGSSHQVRSFPILFCFASQGVTDFALSTGSAPYKVAIFTPGKKAAPATVRVYEFPNLEANQVCFAVALLCAACAL